MVAVAGSFELQGAITITAEKGTSAGITKGDVCSLSSNKWITASTSASGPFAVAIETTATATTTQDLITGGIVYVTADGTINPNASVVVSASTAGHVQASATPFAAGVIGRYLGHENEPSGTTVPTQAVDGDIIRILLGGPL